MKRLGMKAFNMQYAFITHRSPKSKPLCAKKQIIQKSKIENTMQQKIYKSLVFIYERKKK
jgi:hypothetical protein